MKKNNATFSRTFQINFACISRLGNEAVLPVSCTLVFSKDVCVGVGGGEGEGKKNKSAAQLSVGLAKGKHNREVISLLYGDEKGQ